ncbi:hypothetical protein VTO73DRAFT_6282 [Trametes versicolor]
MAHRALLPAQMGLLYAKWTPASPPATVPGPPAHARPSAGIGATESDAGPGRGTVRVPAHDLPRYLASRGRSQLIKRPRPEIPFTRAVTATGASPLSYSHSSSNRRQTPHCRSSKSRARRGLARDFDLLLLCRSVGICGTHKFGSRSTLLGHDAVVHGQHFSFAFSAGDITYRWDRIRSRSGAAQLKVASSAGRWTRSEPHPPFPPFTRPQLAARSLSGVPAPPPPCAPAFSLTSLQLAAVRTLQKRLCAFQRSPATTQIRPRVHSKREQHLLSWFHMPAFSVLLRRIRRRAVIMCERAVRARPGPVRWVCQYLYRELGLGYLYFSDMGVGSSGCSPDDARLRLVGRLRRGYASGGGAGSPPPPLREEQRWDSGWVDGIDEELRRRPGGRSKGALRPMINLEVEDQDKRELGPARRLQPERRRSQRR